MSPFVEIQSTFRPNRRSLMSLAAGAALTRGWRQATSVHATQADHSGILAAVDEPGQSLALIDHVTGDVRFRYDVGPRPNAAWGAALPGVALVRTETSLAIIDANSGATLPVALPETVAPNLSPTGIQFRGSDGYERVLVGTPNSDADTYLIDLLTGERRSVVGLLGADKPPVSLQNVAVAADDRHLLTWDGRTTWIVDLTSNTSRIIAPGQFTFSAGFSENGSQLVYSQQLANGSTQLRLQNSDGTGDLVIGESLTDILVSLWTPARDLLLLDERSDAGGVLAVFDPATANREELLTYTGATNVVQFSPDGRHALAGIEGEQGRDWYQLTLSLTEPSSRLLKGLEDAVIYPGFEFDAAWALATPPVTEMISGTVKAVDLTSGAVSDLISGIATDALLSGQIVAPTGNAALLTIDSFTELAVHFLRLDDPVDIAIDLMKGGSGVIAPDGSGFAISHNLNTGGSATVVYDQTGAEGATFPGRALTWI